MKRTQVYFEEDDWARLQARAKASGRSGASIVRDAVAEYLAREPDEQDPILAMIEWAERNLAPEGAPTDGALNHDHYLYGWPKEGEPWPQHDE